MTQFLESETGVKLMLRDRQQLKENNPDRLLYMRTDLCPLLDDDLMESAGRSS